MKVRSLLLLVSLFVNVLSFTQVKDDDYYNFQKDDMMVNENIKESDNPFNSNPLIGPDGESKDLYGSTGGGISDIQNMEMAMTQTISSEEEIKKRDTFVKYDVKVNERLNINKFSFKGLWRIAYKEKYDTRIVPFYQKYEQKVCLNDTVLFASEYIYATTTCFVNALFFDSAAIKGRYVKLKHQDQLSYKDASSGLASSDSTGSYGLKKAYRMALYERFGVDQLYTLSMNCQTFNTSYPIEIYVINNDLISLNFSSVVYYLERIKSKRVINPDDPIEKNCDFLSWKSDFNRYNLIVGKDINDFIVLLHSDAFYNSTTSSKLRILFYPPKVGDNYLVIDNIAPDAAGENIVKNNLYTSSGELHNMISIAIPMKLLKSPMLSINFYSSDSKRYPWGLKYRIDEK